MAFSRQAPSPRYRELTELYKQLHAEGEKRLNIPAAETFAGQSLAPHVPRIKTLIEVLGARSLLDYGAGKGMLYQQRPFHLTKDRSFPSLQAFWGVVDLVLYDPAFPPHATLPSGRFDAVISVDVLEHCPEEDIPWILREIFGIARDFVYLNVASYPARKTLPNGENAHTTQRPAGWWQRQLDQVVAGRPGLRYYASVVTLENGKKLEQLLSGKGPLS